MNLLRSISGHIINISTLCLVNSDYLCFLMHGRLLACWCGMLFDSFQYLGSLSWLLCQSLPLFARGVWPFRGFRIGEARKPGPSHVEIDLNEPEPLEDIVASSVGRPTPVHFGPDVDMLSPSPFSAGRPLLRCPMCTGFSTKGPVRGFMLHLTSRHCGAKIDERARAALHGLERGICIECHSLRPFSSSSCHRCSSTGPPRDIRVGDCIQGTRRQERNLEEVGVEVGPSQVEVRELMVGAEREAFLTEVRS